MNKLDAKHSVLTVSYESGADLEAAGRLIVLVPPAKVDLNLIANRVWRLADARAAGVLFLGLYNDPAHEPGLRRDLVTLSAMLKNEGVSADVIFTHGKDWVSTVRTHFQTSDMLVCFAEQRAGFSHKPLSQILQSELDAPVYVLSGLSLRKDANTNWALQILSWAGSMVIIAGFFMLQIKINHLPKDWFENVLMLMTIPFELWMIWGWNSLFE